MRRTKRLFRAMRRQILWMITGAAVGIVFAIPVSYLVQPAIVRGLLTLGEYCGKVIDGLPRAMDGGADLLGCGHRVAVTAAIMGTLGAYAGSRLGLRRRGRG